MRRRSLLVALLLAPAVARAQRIEVTLPSWCTDLDPERDAAAIEVLVHTDLDEVDVNGVPLRRVPTAGLVEGRAFAGSIDLLSLLGDKELYGAVGDLELHAEAVGARGAAAAAVICRLHRTVMEIAERRLLAAAGKRNAWAAAYRGKLGKSGYVIIDEPDQAWKQRAVVTFPDLMTWQLNKLEVIFVARTRHRVLERCPACAYEGLDVPMRCPRSRDETTVRAYAARNGALIGRGSLTGPAPAPCRRGTPPEAVVGGPVRKDDLEAWIRAKF